MIVYFIIGYLFIAMCTSIGILLDDYRLSSAENIEIYLEWKDSKDFLQYYVVMGVFWPLVLPTLIVKMLLPFIFKKLVITIVLCLKNIGIKFDKEDDKK